MNLVVCDGDPGSDDFMCKRLGAKIFFRGPRVNLVVCDGDPGSEDFMCKRLGAKIFLRGPRDRKVLLRYFASC